MTSKRNGPKRFTPTTLILIIALLAAVAGASRLVTPAPPEPPKMPGPAKSPGGPLPTQQQKDMLAHTQANERHMQEQMHNESVKLKAQPPDPNAMSIDNTFFLQTKPGSEGLKQTEEQVKKQAEVFEAYKRKINANKKNSTPPVGQPRPEPVAPAG